MSAGRGVADGTKREILRYRFRIPLLHIGSPIIVACCERRSLQRRDICIGILFCDYDKTIMKGDFFMRIKESAKELKNQRSLVVMAMLLALRVALGFVTTIQVTESIKIGFTIFPTTVACMMFGPVPGLVMGGAADLIGFFLRPTGAFFPGYTLDSMVAGFIYGCFFYKRDKIQLSQVVSALATVTFLVNLCMTTSWLSIQLGVKDFGMFFSDSAKAWEAFSTKFQLLLGGRAFKNICMFPINVAGVYFILNAVRNVPVLRPYFYGPKKEENKKETEERKE